MGKPRLLFDFHGGIHPPQNKTLSNQRPIRPAPLPAQLILPLNMHLGAPAKPVVQVGDEVLKGQKIAEAQGAVSLPVHAPTSGKVVAIGPRPIQHPSGLDAPCIVIEPDGREQWCELHPLPDWRTCCPPSALIPRLREAGVAGMGGAGFPSAVKLSPRAEHPIEQLVINAVECEPYITADDMLMRERADQIIAGVEILRHILNPKEVIVGIEDNKPQAIEAMRRAATGSGIEIAVVPTKYPSGGEKQLIYMLTGKEVPSGGIPAQVGVVCHNTGTALAIHRAIVFGEPLISRVTTLTGKALREPGNMEVLLGTPVSALLDAAGADMNRIGRLVMGGPMMGFTLHSSAIPVVKTTNCILAATAEELPPPATEQPCIRCGSCADVCPADLLPQQLFWYSKNQDLERAQQYNLMDCIECGACAYVCPSHIPLVQYYRFAKGEVRKEMAEQQKADRARQRFEARQDRLAKEQAEKEARRKARLEGSKPAAASGVDVAALKAASLEASAAYKAAVKALKAAEAEGSDQVAALASDVEQLKAKADAAKAAVRDAGNAPAAPVVDVAALKAASLEASAAYKAAVKALKEAEAAGQDVTALRTEADALKAKADAAKAAVRDAGPATAKAAPVQPATAEQPAAEKADDGAERAQKMKALKTAFNMSHKHFKEATAALEHAEREGADNLEELRKQVERFKLKADKAKAALGLLVDQAKADMRASGSDLKSLKIEAAQTEAAARQKARELEAARVKGDDERINVLSRELDALQREAQVAAGALKAATDEQGLADA
ncbi:MAG: electron transport complex subunit RsxC [Alcanivoracaceae bacterium]|nr:electron transport complex subunit RsxC [Alcanivoracaceae bacterium]